MPLEPPQLAAPHPLPVTVAFLYKSLKRMHAVLAGGGDALQGGNEDGLGKEDGLGGIGSHVAVVVESAERRVQRFTWWGFWR